MQKIFSFRSEKYTADIDICKQLCISNFNMENQLRLNSTITFMWCGLSLANLSITRVPTILKVNWKHSA